MITAKDFLGQELKVGDKVICSVRGTYALQILEIEKISPKTLLFNEDKNRPWGRKTVRHNEVVKIPEGGTKND